MVIWLFLAFVMVFWLSMNKRICIFKSLGVYIVIIVVSICIVAILVIIFVLLHMTYVF